MITFEEALSIVSEYARPLGIESLTLDCLNGRVLAEPILAPHDLPLFDNSAVDGFGVRLEDVRTASQENPAHLQLLHTVQAGDSADFTLQKGAAVKILTGAPIPSEVDAVIMQEFSEFGNGTVSLLQRAEPGENIRYRGEEYRSGDVVLEANTVVSPPVVGLLASLGYDSAPVYRQPKISILVTGNELVPPGQPLNPGQIYESNSHSLISAFNEIGIQPVLVSTAADHESALKTAMQQALEESDILVSTGGVSVGEFDLVKEIANSLDIETLFWKVAIKPGKPVFLGAKNKHRADQKLVFGLPGNPVAVLVIFHLLMRPLLLQMTGRKHTGAAIQKARLSTEMKKKPGRLDFVRGKLSIQGDCLEVTPCRGQGSHMLGGLAQADCLIWFALEDSFLAAGTEVMTIPLQWGLGL